MKYLHYIFFILFLVNQTNLLAIDQLVVDPTVHTSLSAEAIEFSVVSKNYLKELKNLEGVQKVETILLTQLEEKQNVTHKYLTVVNKLIDAVGCFTECYIILQDISKISLQIKTDLANANKHELINTGGSLYNIMDEANNIMQNLIVFIQTFIPKGNNEAKVNMLDNKEKRDITRKIIKDLIRIRSNLYMIQNLIQQIVLNKNIISQSKIRNFHIKQPQIDVNALISESLQRWKE